MKIFHQVVHCLQDHYLKTKYDVYGGKDCMNFCESLRQHAIRLTNYKNKKKQVITKRIVGII